MNKDVVPYGHDPRAAQLSAIKNDQIKESLRSLKDKRIKKYNIRCDELTNSSLNKPEFSHIRSYSMYIELAEFIDNGLIVNADTHSIITHHSVNNERDLYMLCKAKGWNTGWYDSFCDFLRETGYSC